MKAARRRRRLHAFARAFTARSEPPGAAVRAEAFAQHGKCRDARHARTGKESQAGGSRSRATAAAGAEAHQMTARSYHDAYDAYDMSAYEDD